MNEYLREALIRLGLYDIIYSIYSRNVGNRRLRKIYIKSAKEYIKTRNNRNLFENDELTIRLNVHKIEKSIVENLYDFLRNPSMFLSMLEKCDRLISGNLLIGNKTCAKVCRIKWN